jgi:hypothetical protein
MKNKLNYIFTFSLLLSTPVFSSINEKENPPVFAIPQALGGTLEAQAYFDDQLDTLNNEIPLREQQTFATVEEGMAYMKDYVFPRLLYISDQGWISPDKSLTGYYRKHWVDYDSLLERVRDRWGDELLRNPYQMIRTKINRVATALIFGEHFTGLNDLTQNHLRVLSLSVEGVNAEDQPKAIQEAKGYLNDKTPVQLEGAIEGLQNVSPERRLMVLKHVDDPYIDGKSKDQIAGIYEGAGVYDSAMALQLGLSEAGVFSTT